MTEHTTTVTYVPDARTFLAACSCSWTQTIGKGIPYSTEVEADAERVAADHLKEHDE